MKNYWQHSMMTLAVAAGLLLVVAADSHALLGFGKKKPLPTPTASLASVSGSVQVQPAGAGAATGGVAGQRLNAGDRVRTGADGKAVVAFSDSSKVQLDANSNFVLAELQPDRYSVRLDVGSLNAWVAKLRGRRFEARSPTAVAAVRGTRYNMVVKDGMTIVSLFDGRLNLTSSTGRSVDLTPGKQSTVEVKGEISEPKPIPVEVMPVPEPVVEIPAPKEPEPAKAEEPKPAEQPKAEEPAPAQETTTTTAPPPNPKQDTTVVSPSAP